MLTCVKVLPLIIAVVCFLLVSGGSWALKFELNAKFKKRKAQILIFRFVHQNVILQGCSILVIIFIAHP
jgi:hypothetical protein